MLTDPEMEKRVVEPCVYVEVSGSQLCFAYCLRARIEKEQETGGKEAPGSWDSRMDGLGSSIL